MGTVKVEGKIFINEEEERKRGREEEKKRRREKESIRLYFFSVFYLCLSTF